MAKIKPGFLSGEYGDFGKWDQCLDVDYNEVDLKFKGKYCLYGMHWPQPDTDQELYELAQAFNGTWLEEFVQMHKTFRIVPITNALCFPSVCSQQEIQVAIQHCKLQHHLQLFYTL